MQSRNWLSLITALLAAFLLLSLETVTAQSNVPEASKVSGNNSSEPASAEQSRKQLLEIEQQLKALNQRPAHQPAVSQQTKAFLMIDDSLKGIASQARNGSHFFMTRLILVNQSQQPLKLIRKQIKISVDGQAHEIAGLPRNLSYQSVLLGKRNLPLNSLNFENEVEIPPGKQGGLWIVLSDLPAGPSIPEIEIQTILNGQPVSLNVNRFELGKLQYSVQRMGPNQCLAELTVKGELNSINIGSLMHEVDLLTGQNIKRFVIHFPNQNSQVDSTVKQWLPRAAAQIGMNTIVEPPFPLFPTMIRELHLSGDVIKDEKTLYLGEPRVQVTHATEEEAIHAALDSAMSVLSREKVSEQIRGGSPSVKIAALISGGRQLTNEELPLVSGLTKHQNPQVQEAALYALRYFGDPRAFERLAEVANSPPGPQFEMAVASLAESRFTEGQTLLLKLLKQHPPESQKVIIGIIAQSPRPQWSAAIYAFLSNDNQELRQAAMKALVLNGHPKLFEVLTDALNSQHAELREVAFRELIKRKDAESEALAINYVLAQLQLTAPSQDMLAFIDRLKDPRAIPVLFQHLQNSKLDAGMRIAVIKTLASIGDQTVEEQFLKVYPHANASEKLLILGSLQKVESPHYFELAAQALEDSNPSIVKGTTSGLQASGSNEAVTILQNALRKTDQSATWNAIYTALFSIGTPEARRVIMAARHEGTLAEKQRAAQAALTNLYQRSPANNYLKNGEREQNKKAWQTAINEYETAISIDSLLVPAYLGIVNAKNSLQQYEEALKYADLALKIDDMHPRLYVAKGLIFSNQAKSAEALQQFKKAIEIAPLDSFAYTVLASHYAKHQQYQEALETYDAAIEANPLYMNVYEFKADLLLTMEKPDEALKVYDSAIEANQRHTKAYFNKITLLRKLKRYHQALVVCDDLLKRDANAAPVMLTKAGIFQQLVQLDDAVAACDDAIEADPRYLNSYYFKADLLLSLQKPEEAIKVYDSAIEVDPKSMSAYSGKITLLRKLKRYHEALAVCDEILKLDADSVSVSLTKASIFQQLAQLDDALAACDDAIRFNPQYLLSYIIKTQILNEAEKWDESLKVYDQLIRINDTYLDAYTGRGHTNLQKSDWKAAQKDFQKAFDLDNKSSQAITGLAICMVYNHQDEKAISFVERQAKQFEQNNLFQYNVACVFGRALINLKDQAKTPEVQQRIKEYQEKAIRYLATASRHGFDDVEWMQKDPDLSELQELPAFKSLVKTITQAAEQPRPRRTPEVQDN